MLKENSQGDFKNGIHPTMNFIAATVNNIISTYEELYPVKRNERSGRSRSTAPITSRYVKNLPKKQGSFAAMN